MNALPLHTVTTGDADLPPIVLLHGFSMSHAVFTPLMEQLSGQFHLVAPDLRGHGLSPKPVDAYRSSDNWADDIAAIVSRLDHPLLLGWSMGGRVVMDYLRFYGGTALSAIALIGSYTGPVPLATRANRGPLFDESERREGTAKFVRACTRDPLPAILTQTLLDQALLTPHHVRVSVGNRDEDYTATARTTTLPTLVLHGDTDAIVAPAVSAAHNIPGATHVIYADTGHTPFLEKPKRFADDLAAFAQGARI